MDVRPSDLPMPAARQIAAAARRRIQECQQRFCLRCREASFRPERPLPFPPGTQDPPLHSRHLLPEALQRQRIARMRPEKLDRQRLKHRFVLAQKGSRSRHALRRTGNQLLQAGQHLQAQGIAQIAGIGIGAILPPRLIFFLQIGAQFRP